MLGRKYNLKLTCGLSLTLVVCVIHLPLALGRVLPCDLCMMCGGMIQELPCHAYLCVSHFLRRC
jgi:hypothetical protein